MMAVLGGLLCCTDADADEEVICLEARCSPAEERHGSEGVVICCVNVNVGPLSHGKPTGHDKRSKTNRQDGSSNGGG